MSLNAKQRSFLELLKGTATGFGKVFFVGLESQSWHSELVSQFSPGSVKGTLSQALSACVSGRGDTVVVLPGTHTQTAELDVTKSCTIMGLPGMAGQTVLTTSATSGHLIDLAASCNVANLTLHANASGADAEHEISAALNLAASNCTVTDCLFDTKEGGTANDGITIAKAMVNTTISGCTFLGTRHGIAPALSQSGDVIDNLYVENCRFVNPTVSAIIEVADPVTESTALGLIGSIVKDCTFMGDGSGSVINFGVASGTASVVLLADCWFSCVVGDLNLGSSVDRIGGAVTS